MKADTVSNDQFAQNTISNNQFIRKLNLPGDSNNSIIFNTVPGAMTSATKPDKDINFVAWTEVNKKLI